jgi:hypothetical protein
VLEDSFGKEASRRTPGLRNHAKCAAVSAAFLDLQVRTGQCTWRRCASSREE